jgi:hypothetical protein
MSWDFSTKWDEVAFVPS